jgi:HSP20 family protein
VAFGPFAPLLVNQLGHYFNGMQGDCESIRKDMQTYTNAGELPLSVDIQEEDAAFLIKVDVPGITREDIKVKVTDERLLVISAQRKMETSQEEEDKTGFVRKERRFGKFSRSLRVPKSVDVSGITAEVKDGVMTVTLPKNPEEVPKEQQIQIS